MTSFTMASPSPQTPSPSPGAFTSHRSFTLPTRLSEARPSSSSSSKSSAADIETLFESPRCKIVSFTPALPLERSRLVSGNTGDSHLPVGELICGSKTERMIALGPLRVHRVPGSVAFLTSGKIVHSVFPKSSCWCVDGKTQFVLSAPAKKYYRIELPCETEADQDKADEFKNVLAKICLYETTACPFKRGFYVELPEIAAVTPKRPWRPKHEPGSSSPWSPEGQQLVDGARIERTFPSPVRGLSQSPRRPYQSRMGSSGPSDVASVSIASMDEENTPLSTPAESKVPKIIAAYDEFGFPVRAPPDSDSSARRASHGSIKDASSGQDQMHEVPKEYSMKPVETPADSETSMATRDIVEEETSLGQDLSRNELGDLSEIASLGDNSFEESTAPHSQFKTEIESIQRLADHEYNETSIAPRTYAGRRSVTAPAFPSVQPTKLKVDQIITVRQARDDCETESLASIESTDSFRSLHSPTSPGSTTGALEIPAFEPREVEQPSRPKSHTRDNSSVTITIKQQETPADLPTPTWPDLSPTTNEDPDPDDDDLETGTESDTKSFITAGSPPSPPTSPRSDQRQSRTKDTSHSLRINLRRRRRTRSPMPPPATLYHPPATLSGHLRDMILNKTATLLLGPSVQLVALMLNLARRFADGKLKNDTYTYDEQGRAIPCDWLDSEAEMSSEEDDYGISIGGMPEGRMMGRRRWSGSGSGSGNGRKREVRKAEVD